jgi:DNA-binding transcriptional ArsR family regulator
MPQHALREREPGLDLVFHALADPTRRSVVERLGRGPTATTELARPFPMALPSFIQHLEVLVHSGLVTSHKQGRVRTYTLLPDRLGDAQHWLATQRDLWNRRLDQLDAFLLGEDHDPTETNDDKERPR